MFLYACLDPRGACSRLTCAWTMQELRGESAFRMLGLAVSSPGTRWLSTAVCPLCGFPMLAFILRSQGTEDKGLGLGLPQTTVLSLTCH